MSKTLFEVVLTLHRSERLVAVFEDRPSAAFYGERAALHGVWYEHYETRRRHEFVRPTDISKVELLVREVA